VLRVSNNRKYSGAGGSKGKLGGARRSREEQEGKKNTGNLNGAKRRKEKQGEARGARRSKEEE
jgi:hypothetical protein